jgi:hypothetical protein
MKFNCRHVEERVGGDLALWGTWSERVTALVVGFFVFSAIGGYFPLVIFLFVLVVMPLVMLAPPRRYIDFSPAGGPARIRHTGIGKPLDFTVPVKQLRVVETVLPRGSIVWELLVVDAERTESLLVLRNERVRSVLVRALSPRPRKRKRRVRRGSSSPHGDGAGAP